MLLLLLISSVYSRLIIFSKDSYNVPNQNPIAYIDQNFTKAITNDLMTTSDASSLTSNFFSYMISTWGINITAGQYYAPLTGYYLSMGYAIPTTIIDPLMKIIVDTHHPFRPLEDWIVTVSAWYVGFNTTFNITSGPNTGVAIDSNSAILYLNYYFVRSGKDWSNPAYKEFMPCQTDVTARFFPNMYINAAQSNPAFFGGVDDLIRYTCFDQSTSPPTPCNKFEVNAYTINANSSIDENARVITEC